MEISSITLQPIPAAAPAAQSVLAMADFDRTELRMRQLRKHHRTMLEIAFFIVAVSFVLRLGDAEGVSVVGTNVELPNLCGSRALFGVSCPGCGLTHSFVAIASGELQQSLKYHRLGWLLMLAVLAQIPYRIFALRELRFSIAERVWPSVCGYFLIAVLFANWLLTLAT
jgi:Protein of unknown function (DUF2752)